MNEPELIQSIQQNQYNLVIKKLYGYLPVVKKFVMRNSGTRQEAEDIFQEALIIFYNKARQEDFVLSSHINTYLFGICRLLWMDELKKKNRVLKQDVLSENNLQAELFTDIEDDRKIKQAQMAVMKLGDKCRELLELFYFKKLGMQEIAARLGLGSEKTAKNQKYRCIEKAKSHYHLLSN